MYALSTKHVKHVQSRWLNIAQVLFCVLTETKSRLDYQ